MKRSLFCFALLTISCKIPNVTIGNNSVDYNYYDHRNYIDASVITIDATAQPQIEPQIEVKDANVPAGVSCPEKMTHIKGNYCINPQQTCIDWIEMPSSKFGGRCRKFAPSTCNNDVKMQMEYCIDTFEYVEEGQTLPKNHTSYVEAESICKSLGKRLCTHEEWNFACEGEQMNPYPHGLERGVGVCNFDTKEELVCGKEMCDLRRTASDFPKCVSVFGVHGMVGNVDELVTLNPPHHCSTNGLTIHSGLKGGWWSALRNRCRPVTDCHWEYYKDTQTGFRCCKEASR